MKTLSLSHLSLRPSFCSFIWNSKFSYIEKGEMWYGLGEKPAEADQSPRLRKLTHPNHCFTIASGGGGLFVIFEKLHILGKSFFPHFHNSFALFLSITHSSSPNHQLWVTSLIFFTLQMLQRFLIIASS